MSLNVSIVKIIEDSNNHELYMNHLCVCAYDQKYLFKTYEIHH